MADSRTSVTPLNEAKQLMRTIPFGSNSASTSDVFCNFSIMPWEALPRLEYPMNGHWAFSVFTHLEYLIPFSLRILQLLEAELAFLV